MKPKIIKGVPPPKRTGGQLKYPFNELEAGDHFEWPFSEAAKVRTAAYKYGKSHGVRFAIRTKSARIVGCWRVL